MLEAAPANRRMASSSWQLGSQNLGSLAGGLIGVGLGLGLSKSSYSDWGWRVPFAIGVLIAPVGVYVRSRLTETLVKSEGTKSASAPGMFATVIRSNWAGLLLSLALIAGGTITQYFLLTMTPYAIRTLHLPDSTAMLGTVTLGVTGFLGALAGGRLADRFGIRIVAITPRVVLVLLLLPIMKFLVMSPSAATLVLAISILSLLQAASAAVLIMLIPLIFPPSVRATGLSIAYALGVAIFGGTATYVVTWLVGVTGDPLASTYYVVAANVVAVLAILSVRNADYGSAWPPPADRAV
jgi:MFS family permease